MAAISYTRAEVKAVIDDSRELLHRVSGDGDPNRHELRAVLPSPPAPVDISPNRPLLATAVGDIVQSGADKSLWTVMGGYLPGYSDAVAADVELTYTPDQKDTRTKLYGLLQATFRLPTEDVDGARFRFQLDGSQALPLPGGGSSGEPGGAGDVFRCVLRHGADAIIPSLLAGLTGLSAGPEGFLAAAAMAAAGALPQAVSGAIGCFTDGLASEGELPMQLLVYPVENVERVLEIRPGADVVSPAGPDSRDNLVCASDEGLFRLTGRLLEGEAAATSISGRLKGEVATMPALWQYTVEVPGPTVNVSIVSLTEPKFEETYKVPTDDPRLLLEPCGSSPAGFDLACLISSAGGPVLALVRETLPELRKGLDPFLRALLDGAGNALGSAVTGVVRQCLGGKQS